MLSCRMTTRSVGEDDLVANIISAEEFVEEVCDIVEETLAFALGGTVKPPGERRLFCDARKLAQPC